MSEAEQRRSDESIISLEKSTLRESSSGKVKTNDDENETTMMNYLTKAPEESIGYEGYNNDDDETGAYVSSSKITPDINIEDRAIDDEFEIITLVDKVPIEKSSRLVHSEDFEEERIICFLRDKGISEYFICRLLKNGLSEGHDRFLRSLGVTSKELAQFQWKKRFDGKFCKLDESRIDDTLGIDPDNLYLKKHFGFILMQALKELVKKKPRDPFEFLGNWLIRCRVSEEREKRRKQFQSAESDSEAAVPMIAEEEFFHEKSNYEG